MKKSVFSKLLLMNIAVVAAAMLVIALLLPQLISGHIFSQREKELAGKGAELIRLAEDYYAGQISEDNFLEMLISLDRFLDARIWVVDREGRVDKASSGGRRHHGRRLELAEEQALRLARGEIVTTRRYQGSFDQTMLSVGVPASPERGSPLGAVILHAPVQGINAAVNSLLKYVLWSGLAAITLASLAGYLFSRRFARPLVEMTRAAQNMGRGDYSGRVALKSEDELGQLAGSLNLLAGQLEETIGALERGKRKFESMVRGMQEGVVGVNSAGELIYFNEAAQKMLHLDAAAIGQPVEQTLPEEVPADPFRETLAGGKGRAVQVSFGDNIYSVHVSPVEDEAEEPPGAVALVQDISEAARLERMRRDFVAHVSHELRTPLTILRGYAEALLDGTAGAAEKTRYLGIIRTEIERLNRLISDLLDLSRFQAGGLQLHREKLNLAGLAREIRTGLQSRLAEKRVALEIEIDRDTAVIGDRDRIVQVLLNLVENALRYSPEGGEIGLSAREMEGSKVEISVRDCGPGIAAEELPQLWEHFYRVERSRDRKEGGTGLGLAIVKEIIEAHGESVAVYSAPGEGSTFRFTLPLSLPAL